MITKKYLLFQTFLEISKQILPLGMRDPLIRANITELSHTKEEYNFDKPRRTVNPSSEPQCPTDIIRMSAWLVRHTCMNI